MDGQQAQQDERVQRFGLGRPPIHTAYREHRFVAVGNDMFFVPKEDTFPQFLHAYAESLFGEEWWASEYAKPPEARHPAVRWRDHLIQSIEEQLADPPSGGPFIDGPTAAYILLAYDLYALRHHGVLQGRLLKRLRLADQFQGARYEAFVAATFIRAGFDLIADDGKGKSTPSPEFVAVHKATGQRVAVEAKSRCRPGVLGQPGKRTADTDLTPSVGRLVRDAAKKTVADPFLVFVDVNLPPAFGRSDGVVWVSEINAEMDRLDAAWGEPSPVDTVIFTNTPHVYGQPKQPDPPGATLVIRFCPSAFPLARRELIDAVLVGIEQYGRVPFTFEEGG